MKNLNLFRKSARGSEGSTLTSAVVRPLFDRRSTVVKHLAFMLLFLLGSLNVWGATAIITFANQTSGTSDGSAAYTTSNFVSTGIASSDAAFGTITCSATNKCYSGKVNMGLKAGASSNAGSFTISFSTPITNVSQITLNRAAYSTSKSATITVKNGSTTLANAVSTGTNASLNNMDITGLNIASLSGLTVETNKYCYIKSITITYTPSGSSDPAVSLDPTNKEFEATSNSAQEIALSTSNFASAVNSVTCAFYSEATCTNLIDRPTWVNEPTVNNEKTKVTVNVADNDGNARQTWMKITVSDGSKSASAVFAISQKKYSVDYATLPFAYDGNGSGDLPNGFTNSGVGTYNTSPAMKFDGTGDYIIVHFNAAPGTLSYTIKGNSFSGGTFTVQESADGETYTEVESYTTLGDAQNEEHDLNSASRYVKFIYTNKSSGNVALGNIAISEYVAPAAVAKPTISGETPFLTTTEVTLTQAEADAIYYTTDGSDPKTSGDKLTYSAPFTINADGTTMVKAYAVKGSDESDVAEKAFTKATIMTVAQAKTAIDAGGDLSNKYVAGIVSQIDSYNSTYNSLTYWISADGTTSNQLEVYSGKGLNGADFAGLSDLSLGDEVIVKGTLKKFQSTYEFDKNSEIIQLNRTIAAPTFTPDGGGFLTTLNVALASATEGAEVRYTVDGSDPTSTSTLYEDPIELSATTTIKAAAFKDEFVSVIVSRTFTKGTKITVAEALAALESSSPIENQFVYGKVSTAPTSNPNSGRLTYKISDDGAAVDELEVYNGYGLNGASFADKTDLQVGDEVTIYGTLKIYKEKKEFDGGNYLLEFNRPVIPTFSITYVENGANEDIEDVAAATNLPNPLPTVTKNEKVFGGWFTTSTFDGGTEAVAGAALSNDAILYAKWNDLSPWASVYTSNIELSTEGGTSASVAKVIFDEVGEDGSDAIKAGTGNAFGAIKVTVPAQATALHYHAYGWNGEAVTLSITAPDGVTVTPASQVIESNTGVKSSTPFTLAEGSDPKTEAYHAVSLSGNTEEIELTFTATGGKRFVLFGVNQEGGVVPELQSIEISGDLNKKSGYKAGDALDLEGLTVSATYTLGGTPQTPVDITDDVALEWSYDPLVVDQTSVTITATYKGQTDDIEIALDEAVASADPKIYVDKLSVNFGTVAPNASVEDKTITVTLTNVAAATATLGGTKPEAFSIDKTALVNGDVITISVASTANVGTYSATITISDDAHNAESKVVNLSLTVEDVETPVSTTSNWVAAEAADLVDGAEVLIVGVNNTDYYAMGVQNSNNRAAVAASVDGEGVLTPGEGTMSFILVAQGDGTFALRTSNSKYLYAASSSKNYLRSQADVDNNAKWTLTTTSASAEASENNHVMQFNSGSSIFSCYGSASQKPIALYVPQVVEPVYEEVRSGLEVNRHYTVCLPKNITHIKGATFWNLQYKNAGNTEVYLVEETAPEAGKPYIIQATDTKLEVVYGEEIAADPVENGALRGTFTGINATDFAALEGTVYLLINNAIRPRTAGNYLDANRAYVRYDELTVGTPASIPGRRVKAMPMAPQVATGVDKVPSDQVPNTKVLINGQLFILRGEKMYDAKGQLVK